MTGQATPGNQLESQNGSGNRESATRKKAIKNIRQDRKNPGKKGSKNLSQQVENPADHPDHHSGNNY
jgi:hypothetical protein